MRKIIWVIMGVVAACMLAETTLRLLQGDSLLYRADPEIEYLPAPNQAVLADGVDMRTNSLGMRSDPADATKPPGVFRVLVIGDSIVFGHTNTAHANLATSLLSNMQIADGRRVEALNVSATSWGPGNMLAWLDKHGTVQADAIVLVLSTHDLGDDRTFAPPDRDVYPQAEPVSALMDWMWRKLTPDPADSSPVDPRTEGDAQAALPLLMQRVAAAPSGGCLIIHPTKEEWAAKTPAADEQRLEATGLSAGLAVFYGRSFIREASDYSDGIHLSRTGQQSLARAIAACPALENAVR